MTYTYVTQTSAPWEAVSAAPATTLAQAVPQLVYSAATGVPQLVHSAATGSSVDAPVYSSPVTVPTVYQSGAAMPAVAYTAPATFQPNTALQYQYNFTPAAPVPTVVPAATVTEPAVLVSGATGPAGSVAETPAPAADSTEGPPEPAASKKKSSSKKSKELSSKKKQKGCC